MYVEEPYRDYMKLLHAQEPGWGRYNQEINASWITAVEESYASRKSSDSRALPYMFGSGYSQVVLK